MKFVVQRVLESEVFVNNLSISKISRGYMVLIGISHTDTKEIADKMIRKLINLRIFEDANGKTNLDLKTVNGQLLLVSQFTLYADCKHGNRPSFIDAAKPNFANDLYEYIIAECKKEIEVVEKGQFGADMKVHIVNDGPFTVVLNSDDLMT